MNVMKLCPTLALATLLLLPLQAIPLAEVVDPEQAGQIEDQLERIEFELMHTEWDLVLVGELNGAIDSSRMLESLRFLADRSFDSMENSGDWTLERNSDGEIAMVVDFNQKVDERLVALPNEWMDLILERESTDSLEFSFNIEAMVTGVLVRQNMGQAGADIRTMLESHFGEFFGNLRVRLERIER